MSRLSGSSSSFDPWSVDSSISDSSLGSLFDPWGDHPVGQAHETIRRLYHSARSFICPAGTTVINKLALNTLITPGDEILVERDCHISIVQTLNEIGAQPRWVVPPHDSVLGINLAITPDLLADALTQYPRVRAAVFTSPKYFGVVGDIRRCVEVCHERGCLVLVDEAHGACLAFHSALPTSGVEAGADLVSQSTHKTTEAWSQGSVLHINNESLIPRFLHALHGTPSISTSFNFGIVASVEEAVVELARSGTQRLTAAIETAASLRRQVNMIPGFVSWGFEQAGQHPGFVALDPLRVTVDVTGTGLTGIEVERALQQPSELPPVVAELGDIQHVLFLVTYGNSPRDVSMVARRLAAVSMSGSPNPNNEVVSSGPGDLPRPVLSPREAYWAVARGETRRMEIDTAIGQVSGECIAVYPPGNAIIVHGEVITNEVVAYLSHMASLGAHLKGASEQRFQTIQVLA